MIERISHADLACLVDREIALARSHGLDHIHDVAAFRRHAIGVARRAEAVAARLQAELPAGEAPDPIALFAAGAWHDGGKIRHGDDYHEIASAVEILDQGREWGLVSGTPSEADAALRRAARAVLPDFAMYEQWEPGYRARNGARQRIEPSYSRLTAIFRGNAGTADAADPTILLPDSIDSLVLMYADMIELDPVPVPTAFEESFARRWSDIARRAESDDPELARILPVVKPRVYDGCALVQRFLTLGYEPDLLERFRRQTRAVYSRHRLIESPAHSRR